MNPDDPIDYIQKFLTTIGRQIEKTETETKMTANNKQLFESNQVERTKVLFNVMLSQLHDKFEDTEKLQQQTTSNEINKSNESRKETKMNK